MPPELFLTLAFLAFTVWVVAEHGFVGTFAAVLATWPGVQVMTDLVIGKTVTEARSALDTALRKALATAYPEVESIHLEDYKVRIIDGREGTRAVTRVLIDHGNGRDRWTTVGASSSIVEASLVALIDGIEHGLWSRERNPMKATIVLLPGDGIGPEVVHEARLVLDLVAARYGHQFVFAEHLIGGGAIDATGDALPTATRSAASRADAVLLGAVGGPKWDDPKARVRPEQGLLAIRKELRLFANLPPVKVHPALAHASPLKPEKVAGVDLLFLRELTGGLYFGWPKFREDAFVRAEVRVG